MSERCWYRLHWATWLAVVLVGGALCYRQMPFPIGPMLAYRDHSEEQVGGWHIFTWLGCGWPFVHRAKVTFAGTAGSFMPQSFPSTGFRLPQRQASFGLALNAAICLSIIACTVLGVQRATALKFGVKSLFGMTAVAGLLLLIWRYDQATDWQHAPYPTSGDVLMYSPLMFDGSRLASLPILFGLGCTIYTAGWLAFGLAVRGASTLRVLFVGTNVR